MIPKVGIIILNWNGLRDTLECLESLKKIDYKNYEVILVDNNSIGNDINLICKDYGDYLSKVIINKENLGFSGGNNVGIHYAIQNGAEAVVLLNNDTIVEQDFLSKLVEKSLNNPEVGLLTPIINYMSNEKLVWFAGGHISRIRSSGFPDGIGKLEHLFTKDRFCTFASGCCMYIKKETIMKLGSLDENYFLYLEDSDYSFRAHQSGYKILYVASSKIYHKVSSTTSKTNSFLTLYYSTRNRLYFARKHLGNYYYIFKVYLWISLWLKTVFKKQKRNLVKIIKLAYEDAKLQKMGRTNIFD